MNKLLMMIMLLAPALYAQVNISGGTIVSGSAGSGIPYPPGNGIPIVVGGTAWGVTLTAPVGAIVGLTDTQTLTNKTLTTPVLTSPNLGTPTVINLTNATNFPTLNQNTTGTAASAGSLNAASALPNGTTGTTQTAGDATTAVATDAFVHAAVASITPYITSITTTGSSGPSTVTSGVLNVPQYTGGSGSVTTLSVGNVPNIFNASVANPTTTPAVTFTTINFAGHSFFGNNTGSSQTPTPTFIGTQDYSPNILGTDSGAANAYVVTLSPAATSLVSGLEVRFFPSNASTTTTPTLNLNGLGVKTITRSGQTALIGADLSPTEIADLIYDGTNWELQNPKTGYANYWNGVLGPTASVSGGLLYGSSTTVAAYSAVLPTGDFVLGGGAGAAPTATFSIVPSANGGTGISTSASTGLPIVTAGVWSVSTTQALPNGTTATTQAISDNSTKVATTAFVKTTESGTVSHTLTGATPVAVVNSATVAGLDVENLVMSANVTSFTLPAAAAVTDGETLRFLIAQPASGGPYTLPTGTASSPFTVGSGTTLTNSVPGGCPTIGTTASATVPSSLYAVVAYEQSITQWIILGCQLGNTAQTSVAEFTLNAGYGGIGSSTANSVLSSTQVKNAGHFTSLQIVNLSGGTCTTAPTLNVFDGTTNVGTALIASTSTQTKGVASTQAQTLAFAAGDTIGIYISAAGSGCTAPAFTVAAQVAEP